MIAWLLREAEKDPSRIFMEKDLIHRSKNAFYKARKDGLLQFLHSAITDGYFPCSTPCSAPCSGMKLSPAPKGRKGIYAVAFCEEDPNVDQIVLSRRDLSAYQLNIDAVRERFHEGNYLHGKSDMIDQRLHYLGITKAGGFTIAVVLAFFPDTRSAMKSLLALPSSISWRYERILVVFPSLVISDQAVLHRLELLNIFTTNLNDKKLFNLDLSVATKKPPEKVTEIVLTPEQEKEFDRHQFKSRLPIEITGEVEKRSGNLILVDGRSVILGDASFIIFLRLIVELFKGEDGSVFKGDPVSGGGLVGEGLINALGIDQAIHRLRARFGPALKKLKPNKFIEASKMKHIRLSTHVRFISCNKDKLLVHDNPKVRKLAGKLSLSNQIKRRKRIRKSSSSINAQS